MYIACARSVSENVGLLLRNSHVVSHKFELVLFRGNAFCPPLTCNCNGFFGTQNHLVDLTHLNKAVKREILPMSSVDESLTQLGKAEDGVLEA